MRGLSTPPSKAPLPPSNLGSSLNIFLEEEVVPNELSDSFTH